MRALVTAPPLHPQDATAGLGMSYEAFRKGFAKLAGVAPARHRDARLLDVASRLLRDRHRPLK
jgi:hypothetical protein